MTCHITGIKCSCTCSPHVTRWVGSNKAHDLSVILRGSYRTLLRLSLTLFSFPVHLHPVAFSSLIPTLFGECSLLWFVLDSNICSTGYYRRLGNQEWGRRLGIRSEATVEWRLGMRHGYKTRLLSCSKFKKKIPCLWRKKCLGTSP